MSEPQVFTLQGAADAVFDDFSYDKFAKPGEYRAVLLKMGPHEKNGNVTLRCSFGIHAERTGAGPRVDKYVEITPSQQRSEFFRAMGASHLDNQKGPFQINFDEFKNCECMLLLGEETYNNKLKNNVKRMRPINESGPAPKRVPPAGAPATQEASFDDGPTPF